jgi:hypothetical protein
MHRATSHIEKYLQYFSAVTTPSIVGGNSSLYRYSGTCARLSSTLVSTVSLPLIDINMRMSKSVMQWCVLLVVCVIMQVCVGVVAAKSIALPAIEGEDYDFKWAISGGRLESVSVVCGSVV